MRLFGRLILACAVAGVLGSTGFAATEYDPVVRIGRPEFKNLLFFIWGHADATSGKAFRDVIRGLDPEVRSGRLTIQMYQVANMGDNEARDASLLTCVSKENYGRLAASYLDMLAELGSYHKADYKVRIRLLAENYGLPKNLDSCWSGPIGQLRMDKLRINGELFRRKLSISSTPAFVLNGTVVHASTTKDIREKLIKD